MAATQKTKLLVWITALALIMACVPSLTTQSIPTVDPGAIDTLIVETANAAAMQTAAALPSSTTTTVLTPTRNTETPTPTATATVIFIFFSPTPLTIPTNTNLPSSGNYACQVTGTSPENGSKFKPRQEFDAVWTVKNIGKRKWDRSEVEYAYSNGDKLHKVSSYDLDKSVPIGSALDLRVNMQAPKDPGTYKTTWIIHSGSRTFCELSLTIVVQGQPTETATAQPTQTTAAP